MEYLKQDPPSGGTGATQAEDTEELHDDDHGVSRLWVDPEYIDFLIDAALEQSIITSDHGDNWRALQRTALRVLGTGVNKLLGE